MTDSGSMDAWVGVSLPSPPLPAYRLLPVGWDASLPTEKEWFEDGAWWTLLREGELLGAVPELRGMLQSLEFCDNVVKVSWLFEWGCGNWWRLLIELGWGNW